MRRNSKVLVVEDDPHISDLIVFLLQEAGYATVNAHTASQARQFAIDEDPDLVVLDWMLPDTPGDRLCRELKATMRERFLPILMLTARSGLADRVAGLDAGADDFLTKPFHSDELMARVRALLRIRSAELDRLQMIDELRQAYDQLAAAQAQIVQTARLAALGELVAGVAHELNNPLGIILGNAELLPNQPTRDDQRAVSQIIEGAQRARRIVQSLITFARQGKMEEDWHKPRDLVARVLDLKQAVLNDRGIALEIEFESRLPMIWADGAQIQQVILNLLLNAEYAVRFTEQPRIRIAVHQCNAPPPPPPSLPNTLAEDAARMVLFDISDNGVGITDDLRERLFQPFVTTKPVGQGTGLGLALSYGIAMQHGGSLTVDSTPGVGTIFRLALPIAHANATPAPLPNAPEGGRLLVAAEPQTTDLVRRLLHRSGWELAVAQHKDELLELASDQHFDAVLFSADMLATDHFYNDLRHAASTYEPVFVVVDTPHHHHGNGHSSPDGLRMLQSPFTRQDLLHILETSS